MKSKITLLLMLLGVSLQTIAQTGSITGRVTDENNQRLRSAVTLTDSGKVKYATITDADGKFTINSVKPGHYDVKISAVNYKDGFRKGIEIQAGKTEQLNIQLQPVAKHAEEAITVNAPPPPIKGEKKTPMTGKYTIANGSTTTLNDASGGTYSWSSHYTVSENQQRQQFYNPSEESYKKNPENDFMNVKASPLSTMSVDVDRASYSNVRRFINEGQKPPEDAVRVEEMINYFDYDYQQPKGEDPIAIHTELTDCPWQKDHKLLHIGMQARKVATENLPPSNLVFLIDVSGSMESEEKLPLLVAGMKLLVQNLRHIDKVTIVTYAGNAGLVLPPTPGDHKQVILDALDKLTAGGSTAGGAGIKLAYKIAMQNFIKGGNNRVLLATDGDFNVGVNSENELEGLIVKERESGIYLTCLGFGTGNYKDSKMELLADKGNGNYDYIDNLLEAQKTLVSEFGGTLFTVAKDVKAQIEFNPSKVQGYRLVGYENRLLNAEDFKDDKKDAGDMGSGHTVTIIYEIIPVGVKSPFMRETNDLKYQQPLKTEANYNNEFATIKFRYKKPDGNTSKEMVHTIADKTIDWFRATENTRFSCAVAMFGMLLKESKYKGNCTYDEVIAMAETSKNFDKEGYRAEFIRLVKAAKGYKTRTAAE
jgi:Ca-activated chloride channel homolog